jgi:hypothetical protein
MPDNGVIERLFRTLAEQIVHGRVFQSIDEVREAVREFAARDNAEWLIEKNGYLSPLDACAAHLDTNLTRAAERNRVSRDPGPVHGGFGAHTTQATAATVTASQSFHPASTGLRLPSKLRSPRQGRDHVEAE